MVVFKPLDFYYLILFYISMENILNIIDFYSKIKCNFINP